MFKNEVVALDLKQWHDAGKRMNLKCKLIVRATGRILQRTTWLRLLPWATKVQNLVRRTAWEKSGKMSNDT